MPTLTREQKIDKAKNLARNQGTDTLLAALHAFAPLIEAALSVGDMAEYQALNMTRAWTIEVLEERFPAAEEIMIELFENATDDQVIDYAAELQKAIDQVR